MSEEPDPLTNGTHSGSTSSPRTPKFKGLALTEYAANPTPPSEREDRRLFSDRDGIPGGLFLSRDWDIPDEFLLPNGYPDVRKYIPLAP
jgi:threonine dehydratase